MGSKETPMKELERLVEANMDIDDKFVDSLAKSSDGFSGEQRLWLGAPVMPYYVHNYVLMTIDHAQAKDDGIVGHAYDFTWEKVNRLIAICNRYGLTMHLNGNSDYSDQTFRVIIEFKN